MVMRVTTQRQEIFYSSPGRCSNNVRRYPRAENVRDHDNIKPNIRVSEIIFILYSGLKTRFGLAREISAPTTDMRFVNVLSLSVHPFFSMFLRSA